MTGRANALIKEMKDDPHRLLSTILIGNNVVNVGASALATRMTFDLFQSYELGATSSYAIGVVTGVMTFLILVFVRTSGEFLLSFCFHGAYLTCAHRQSKCLEQVKLG